MLGKKTPPLDSTGFLCSIQYLPVRMLVLGGEADLKCSQAARIAISGVYEGPGCSSGGIFETRYLSLSLDADRIAVRA